MTADPEDFITVLHICEHFGNDQVSFHGVARLFELWLPAYDKKRFRVLLCSRQGPVAAAEDRLKASGISPLYLGYGKTDPRNLFKLIRIIRREKVDILHAHGYGACLWARVAGRLLGIPVIVHEHCNYGTVPWFQRPIERVLGPSTRCAFAVSESVRRFTFEKRYIPESVIQLLYSGIPLDQVKPAPPGFVSAFRAEQGVRDGDIVLGVVGRLESHKGHLDAFRAMQRVIKEIPRAVLWVVGDGRYEDVLHAWVRDNRMEQTIRFLGYRSNVLDIIQCFDVQVFPSHQEGTPSTLFEAMAVGNAVVASTADGQGEILREGETGLLFTPGDDQRMAEQLLRVIRDGELRNRLEQNVLKEIKKYDMAECVRVMESAYTELVHRGRA